MQPIRFYFSFRSPFAGIALKRVMHCPEFAELEFELMPVWPEVIFGGHMDNPTDNLFKLAYVFQDAVRQAELAGMDTAHLQGWAENFKLPEGVDYTQQKVGMPMGDEPWEIPHAAMAFARSQDKHWAFAESVYARRFGFDGGPVEDVLQPEVVASIARGVGLDGDAAANAHHSEDIQTTLKAIAKQGEADGVFGVPFFVLTKGKGKEVFWGNDHLEHLLRSVLGTHELPVIAAR
jgi:2-hydroxychromene-2-carboxylate isomerase